MTESRSLIEHRTLKGFRDHLPAQALARGEQWNGASEYHSYARALGDRPTLDVLYAGSRRWAGVQPLIDCGIMRSSARFERFIRSGSSSGA